MNTQYYGGNYQVGYGQYGYGQSAYGYSGGGKKPGEISNAMAVAIFIGVVLIIIVIMALIGQCDMLLGPFASICYSIADMI